MRWGVTYKAFDVDLRCPVTLKVISEKYLGMMRPRQDFYGKRVRLPPCVIPTLPRSSILEGMTTTRPPFRPSLRTSLGRMRSVHTSQRFVMTAK